MAIININLIDAAARSRPLLSLFKAAKNAQINRSRAASGKYESKKFP
jgi:hypothetical protein